MLRKKRMSKTALATQFDTKIKLSTKWKAFNSIHFTVKQTQYQAGRTCSEQWQRACWFWTDGRWAQCAWQPRGPGPLYTGFPSPPVPRRLDEKTNKNTITSEKALTWTFGHKNSWPSEMHSKDFGIFKLQLTTSQGNSICPSYSWISMTGWSADFLSWK